MTATRRDHRPPTPNTAFRKDVAGMQKPSSRPTIPGSPSRRTLIAAAVCGAPFTVGAAGAAAAPARPGPELAPPAEVQPGAAGYEHPGLLHTASDLEEMSVRVESGASPWAQGYERLAANGHAGADWQARPLQNVVRGGDRKSTRLNSSHVASSYAVFCWKTKTPRARRRPRPRP